MWFLVVGAVAARAVGVALRGTVVGAAGRGAGPRVHVARFHHAADAAGGALDDVAELVTAHAAVVPGPVVAAEIVGDQLAVEVELAAALVVVVTAVVTAGTVGELLAVQLDPALRAEVPGGRGRDRGGLQHWGRGGQRRRCHGGGRGQRVGRRQPGGRSGRWRPRGRWEAGGRRAPSGPLGSEGSADAAGAGARGPVEQRHTAAGVSAGAADGAGDGDVDYRRWCPELVGEEGGGAGVHGVEGKRKLLSARVGRRGCTGWDELGAQRGRSRRSPGTEVRS